MKKVIYINQKSNSSFNSVPGEPWDIEAMETFFSFVILPGEPVRLNGCAIIEDVNKFINTHLATIKANNGNPTFAPYYDRLVELKNILENQLTEI